MPAFCSDWNLQVGLTNVALELSLEAGKVQYPRHQAGDEGLDLGRLSFEKLALGYSAETNRLTCPAIFRVSPQNSCLPTDVSWVAYSGRSLEFFVFFRL